MMDDVSYNFYEVVDSAEAYFDIHGTGKGSGWKGYQRWKNENESKFFPTGERSQAYFNGAEESYRGLTNGRVKSHAKALENGWEELGPWGCKQHYITLFARDWSSGNFLGKPKQYRPYILRF